MWRNKSSQGGGMKYPSMTRLARVPLFAVTFLILISVTVKDAHAISLAEIPAMTTEMLAQSFGLSVGDTLQYSGVGTSSFPWSLGLSGTYAGLPVNLSFTSLPGGTSFTSTGTIGSFPWIGSGSWVETMTGPTTFEADLNLAATISGLIGPQGKPDAHSHIVETDTGAINSLASTSHAFNITLDGTVVYTDHGTGSHAGRILLLPPPPQIFPEEWNSSHLALRGTFTLGQPDVTSFTLNGVIGVVPEPSTWSLLITGIACLVGYAWRRQKQTGL
jgi:PEP-CTERM motif